jgi:hypothetical protein
MAQEHGTNATSQLDYYTYDVEILPMWTTEKFAVL